MRPSYKITRKLGIKIYKLRDGWTYFWIFIGLAALSFLFYLFLESYIYQFGKNNTHQWFNTPIEKFTGLIEESFLVTILILILCMCMIDIIMEIHKLLQWIIYQIKKNRFAKRFSLISCCILCGIFLMWGTNNVSSKPELSFELATLEKQAENGDTAALHKLLNFYDNNSEIIVEVVEAIDPNGNEIIEVDNNEESIDNNLNDLYLERLHYWLNKGLAVNDPLAKRIKVMRSYYDDESGAIPYLAEMAENGDGQAALFCGSACFNQGKGPEAFKYLTMAYDRGVPSAGWHLAMCYSRGFGTEKNKEMAIEVLKQSALLDYPEAVKEMKRIEPNNILWKNKADSLEIDFPDFVIIDN